MAHDKEITIYDIAKQLTISATTVSRGLKDHPSVNKITRKKIVEAAKEPVIVPTTLPAVCGVKNTYIVCYYQHKNNEYHCFAVSTYYC